MKLVSFNVNGIRSIITKNFIEDFNLLNADVFSINESKFSEDSHEFFPFNHPNYQTFWTNSKIRKGYSGVAVFTKINPLSVHYGLTDGKYDDEGRAITLEFEDFYYVACYVPNAGENLKRLDFRLQFEIDLLAYLKALEKNKPVIYAGDLNVAHQEIDLKNPKSNTHNPGFTIEERTAMSNLLSNGFIDTFRYLYPEKIQYSWWSYRFKSREKNAGWRIDYFLISESLKDKLKDSIIHTEIMGSDHCPIELIIGE